MEEEELISSLRQLCKRRPKERLAKGTAQDVESHLPRLVHEAHLLHTLVTVLPEPTADLLTSWRAALAARETVITLTRDLPGMYFSILAMEVHAGSRPKRAAGAAPAPQGAPRQRRRTEDASIDAMDVEEEPTAQPEAETDDAAPKGMKGKPHFPLLLC